MMTFAALQRKL